ncbi:MAG: lipopolysaccharide biosynthesis protein [Methylocystis sp.]|uniref:lipopolysaccharide biosynthesis protein n=1 Tax=Methylocystis sp. TaxID=1911079 RepID=UPI003DA3F729
MRERLAALLCKLRSRQAAMGAIVAMAIKACGALLTLAVFTLAARAMTADQFGHLAVWFNAISFLAVAAVFGQDTLIARSYGEYSGSGDYRQAWGAYRFGWVMTLAFGGAFALGLWLFAPLFFSCVTRTTLLAAAFFLLTQTILHYSSHSTRVIASFVVSEVTRELIWRVLLLGVVIWAVLHQGLTTAEFFLAAGVGQILSFGAALFHVRRVYRSHDVEEVDCGNWRAWLTRSGPMWQSAVLEAASMYFDVMLIGYVASPAAAGDYFAAARLANVFLMVLTGLNTYTVSRSATLYFSGQVEKLQEILRSLVLVSTTMLAPLLLLIYIFGAKLLTIFGARFASDYPTLVILSTGCFIMSTCGSASVILLTTGQERLYSRIIAIATVLRVALTSVLAWRFGAPGAAFGWALVNAPLFMLLSAICRREIGVDPSILSLLGPLRAKLAARAGHPTLA